MKKLLYLTVLSSITFAGVDHLNGVYKCRIGSHLRTGEWKVEESEFGVKNGIGQISMRIGDLVAFVSSDTFCAKGIHASLRDEKSLVRSVMDLSLGQQYFSVSLYNDKDLVDVQDGILSCQFESEN